MRTLLDSRIEQSAMRHKLRNRPNDSHIYWWVTGKIEGKTELLGPYDTEEEADEYGFKGFKNSPYTKHSLRTRDRTEAVRKLRHVFFDESGDLKESTKPMHHLLQQNI